MKALRPGVDKRLCERERDVDQGRATGIGKGRVEEGVKASVDLEHYACGVRYRDCCKGVKWVRP